MKSKLLFLLCLVVLLIVPLSYAQDTVVRYWHTMSDPETAKLEELIATFEDANPGIDVEATRYAYDDFKQALLTAIAGGVWAFRSSEWLVGFNEYVHPLVCETVCV